MSTRHLTVYPKDVSHEKVAVNHLVAGSSPAGGGGQNYQGIRLSGLIPFSFVQPQGCLQPS